VGGWVVLPGTNQFFNGFSNNLNLGDDAVATVNMPFTFNHPAGSTTSLDVCSNGRVWLTSNPFGTAYNPVVQDFLNDPPSIGVLWADFYPPGAPAGGGVFGDADPSNQAYYVTWSNVPMYNGANGVGSNTMQLALFQSGQFELRYQSVTNNATTGGDALRGYSTGNGATDPGNRNLATSVPFSTGPGGTTLTLAATGGGRPVLGQLFNQDIGGISAGSPLGFMILGFTSYAPAGIDLTPLGAPGCHQYQSLDADVLFLIAAPGTTTFGLSIPNNASLGGVVVFSQAAVLAPNANALGIVASNGASLSLGI
jgi:hypothetical protein